MNKMRVPMAGPGAGNHAGLRKLGCRVGDIATELFMPSQSTTCVGGKIVRSEFFGFWSQLIASKNAPPEQSESRPFVDKLIEQLQLIDPNMQPSPSNNIPPASIINTIAFMLFCVQTQPVLNQSFANLDKLKSLHQVYSNGLQIMSSNSSTSNTLSLSPQEQIAIRFAQCVDNNSSLKNLMKLIAIRTLHAQSSDSTTNNSPLDIDSVISPLVMYASHIIPKDVRFLDWLRQPTIDHLDVQTNEYGFLYYYLTQLLNEQHRQNHINTEIILFSILKALFDKSHSLPQQIRMALPVAEQTFLALLHIMKSFLQVQAITNVEFLDRGIRLLSSFRWLQFPIGHVAEQMITLLKLEQLSPGINRRRAVYNESIVVSYATNPNSTATSPPPIISNGTLIQPSQYKHTKPIFYLYDTLDSTCLPILNILDPAPFQQQNLVKPVATSVDPSGGQLPPASVLAQSLTHALDSIAPLTQLEVDSLCTLTLDKLYPFVAQLQSLEEQYRQHASTGQFSLEKRQQDYELLRTSILNVAQQNKGNPLLYQLPQHYPLLGEGSTYQQQYPSPPLPLIEHIRVPVELKAKTTEHDGNTQNGYPAAAMFDKLLQIFSTYNPAADKAQPPLQPEQNVVPVTPTTIKPREIRFVLVGNDRLLQHVVTAYFLLRSNFPQVFNGLNVKFFIIPTTRNHFANYLARIDLWYYRHVFTPFRSHFPFVLPFLRDDEIEVKMNHESGLVGHPTQFLRECIVQYVREAQHQYKPLIYKVEARTDPGSAEPSDVIPFLQRVEVGSTPAIEEHKLKGGPSMGQLTHADVQKDKNFIYSPVELTVKYSKVDLVGQPKPEVVDDAIPYQSLLLSHVPRKGDPCAAPDPSSVGLELFAQPSKVDKAKIKKNTLYFEPRQHIAELTCSAPSPFKILVDGVLHGPFRSVRVAIAQTKFDGKTAQFPVQTFFPVQSQ